MNDFDHRQKMCEATVPLRARIKELETQLTASQAEVEELEEKVKYTVSIQAEREEAVGIIQSLSAKLKQYEGALEEIENGHEAVKMPGGFIKRCKLIRSQMIKIASQARHQEPCKECGGRGEIQPKGIGGLGIITTDVGLPCPNCKPERGGDGNE